LFCGFSTVSTCAGCCFLELHEEVFRLIRRRLVLAALCFTLLPAVPVLAASSQPLPGTSCRLSPTSSTLSRRILQPDDPDTLLSIYVQSGKLTCENERQVPRN